MALFLNDWKVENPLEQMASDFEIDIKELEAINIVVATYTYEDYIGDAFVLFEKQGKLYEVNGSHCSCYGLEDQWQPEEVNLDELKQRFTYKEGAYNLGYSYYGENLYAEEVLQAIKEIRELQQEIDKTI